MIWSYGVTTVPSRLNTVLPRTLDSLANAGFDRPRLFVDGGFEHQCGDKRFDDLQVTCRSPVVGAWGNFYLALAELYIREPVCERYALFQDDVIAVRDLRDYLDSCRYPDGTDRRAPGYWNLYTTANSEEAVVDRGIRCGWIEGAEMVNQRLDETYQCGRGALGLVFNREAVGIILMSRSAVMKPISTDRPRRNVDGAVVTAMNLHRRCYATNREWPRGWREYVHGPSLLRHTGEESTVDVVPLPNGGLGPKRWTRNADTFPGEGWSALSMRSR